MEEIKIPLEILGTVVKDRPSGYEGIATQLVRLVNGCVHVLVQSPLTTEDGEIVDSCEFSILQLEGEAIKPLSAQEVEVEKAQRPSPDSESTGINPFAGHEI